MALNPPCLPLHLLDRNALSLKELHPVARVSQIWLALGDDIEPARDIDDALRCADDIFAALGWTSVSAVLGRAAESYDVTGSDPRGRAFATAMRGRLHYAPLLHNPWVPIWSTGALAEAYAKASQGDGIVFQGAAYEGLTCDWLELAFAAGGSVLSEDGTKATIDSPQNVEATQLMVDVIKDGGAPKAVTTYMEPESLAAFQTGKYTFMRNWPYAYALNEKAPKVKGKFKVAPLPEFDGAGKAGVLGGADVVISAYSENPGGALALLDYITSPEHQRLIATEYSLGPILDETYDDPAVKKALPFSAELKQAVSQAKARPVSPVYPQISQAIYKNVNAALTGQTSAADAMKQAQADIDEALATF